MATDQQQDLKYAIGIMSGTSADGADAVLISQDHRGVQILDSESIDYPSELQQHIHALYHNAVHVQEIGQLHTELAKIYTTLCQRIIQRHQNLRIDVIGCHGQTIYHQPSPPNAFSLQIGNAAYLCQQTGIAVVSDFRSADIAVGGQGAPLVPAFHQAVFAAAAPCAVVNIGGIANITHLDQNQQVNIGFDSGPGNTLMDFICREYFDCQYDQEGAIAKSGNCQPTLLEHLLNDPYFAISAPKSTGLEYFNPAWLQQYTDAFASLPKQDLLCTLTHLTAASIAHAVSAFELDTLYICGGGAYNTYLLHCIQQYSNLSVKSTQAVQISPLHVESAAFAWMALRTFANQTSSLKQVTGATKNTICGNIYWP